MKSVWSFLFYCITFVPLYQAAICCYHSVSPFLLSTSPLCLGPTFKSPSPALASPRSTWRGSCTASRTTVAGGAGVSAPWCYPSTAPWWSPCLAPATTSITGKVRNQLNGTGSRTHGQRNSNTEEAEAPRVSKCFNSLNTKNKIKTPGSTWLLTNLTEGIKWGSKHFKIT